MWEKRVLAGQGESVRKTSPDQFGQGANDSCVPCKKTRRESVRLMARNKHSIHREGMVCCRYGL